MLPRRLGSLWGGVSSLARALLCGRQSCLLGVALGVWVGLEGRAGPPLTTAYPSSLQDLGMESTSLDDVLYRYASFRNLVDPITHDLIISLARYIHCPKPVGGRTYTSWVRGGEVASFWAEQLCAQQGLVGIPRPKEDRPPACRHQEGRGRPEGPASTAEAAPWLRQHRFCSATGF